MKFQKETENSTDRARQFFSEVGHQMCGYKRKLPTRVSGHSSFTFKILREVLVIH